MAEVASGVAALGDAIAVLRREPRERVKAHLAGLPQTAREGLKAARIRQAGDWLLGIELSESLLRELCRHAAREGKRWLFATNVLAADGVKSCSDVDVWVDELDALLDAELDSGLEGGPSEHERALVEIDA